MKLLAFIGFDWDEHNQIKIQKKHGIATAAVENAIVNAWDLFKDHHHSETEDRLIAVGPDLNQRTMLVIFTYRTHLERRYIRPISARYMHEKEEKRHQPL